MNNLYSLVVAGAGVLIGSGSLLVFGSSVPPSSARHYYVSAAGDDDAFGTLDQPYRTLVHALGKLRAGDELLVGPGTYEEALGNRIPSGTSWQAPVTLRAADPDVRPTIKPPPGNPRGLHFEGQQYVIVDGFVIDATNVDYDGIKITQPATHHIRIMNVEVKHARRQGVLTTDGAHHLEFVNLDVHSNGSSDFDHGMYISTSQVLISRSRIHHNAGWGVHLYNETDRSAVNNVVVRNNEIFDNARIGRRGDGIIVHGGTGNTVSNNVIYGNRVGIWVEEASQTLILNNTLSRNWGDTAVYLAATARDTVFRNNIVFANASDELLDRGQRSTIANNLAGEDPKFVSPERGLFCLSADSPAIDAGLVEPSIIDDILGVSRVSDRAPDIGAYEHRGTQWYLPGRDPVGASCGG